MRINVNFRRVSQPDKWGSKGDMMFSITLHKNFRKFGTLLQSPGKWYLVAIRYLRKLFITLMGANAQPLCIPS